MHELCFADVPDGSGAVGGLSFSNGNCILVVRLPDGSYRIIDTKPDRLSPVWHLTANQFHALGQQLSGRMGWIRHQTVLDIGDGLVFTMTRLSPGKYAWNLSKDQGTHTFSLGEIAAFCWGYRMNQFAPGHPVRQLAFSRPHVMRASA